MINIKNVSKRFGKKIVLDGLTVDFSSKDVSVIVGTNGSGKTTLFNIISGLIGSDSGNVSIDNTLFGTEDYKEKLFYLPSDFYLPGYMTGNEYARFILSRYENSDFVYFELVVSLFDLELDINKTIETYSFGMKKKLQIAIAVSLNVNTILADEIFSGLDFETVILAQELFIKAVNISKIVVISHDLNTLLKFNKDIWLMRFGRLEKYVGNPLELTNLVKNEGGLNEKIEEIYKY